MHALFSYIVFKILKVFLINICKILNKYLFCIVVFCYILHQQISFQNFIQHNLKKKILATNFPFLRDSLNPTLFNGQNLLRNFLSILPYQLVIFRTIFSKLVFLVRKCTQILNPCMQYIFVLLKNSTFKLGNFALPGDLEQDVVY